MFKKTIVFITQVKTGIYTEGREWNPHEPSIFLGINAEKFHDGITKYVNMAADAVGHAYDATKQFVGKRWYMVAVPIALTLGISVYGSLMAAQPDVEVQEVVNKKRKKGYFQYWMKYYNEGTQKVREFTGGTLDDKVDSDTK